MPAIGIIGAGPAGLTAAYRLSQAGLAVKVFEAGDQVGGMAGSFPLWGQCVDFGPHRFFSSDPRVNQLWLEVVGDRYRMVNRLTRIYYKGAFFNYPLKAFNALRGLGPVEAFACVASYAKARVRPHPDQSTFDAWVIDRFGARLFSIFFKSYTEKLWGIPCADLDADFATQRIKKFSLLDAIKSALLPPARNQHRTLVDTFAYPHEGAGMAYQEMVRRIIANGGVIAFNTPVAAIRAGTTGQGPTIVRDDGVEETFDHVISSMPITAALQRLNAPAAVRDHAARLRFRNTILVYLRIEGGNPFPDQWIYVHSPDVQTGRVTNFRNWVPEITNGQPDTILCLEYWCYEQDAIWRADDLTLIETATTDICKTTLVSADAVKDGKVVRVAKSYPVYERGYKSHLEPVERYLSSIPDIQFIGRYGAFKYNNQDHSILMGLLAAQNITDGKSHDLWKINTDYEYQESSRITEAGLVKD